MKKAADKHRREAKFQVGNKVFLKLQPYCLCSLVSRPNEKLSPQFYGPYELLERIGQVAYRLLLHTTAKIHLVSHMSLLKAFA